MKNIIKNGLDKIKVLVYGGSFDPPHLSHLAVIDCVLKSKVVDQTWVFPCGDRQDKNMILSSKERYKLMTDIFQSKPQVQIRDDQIKTGQMIPTYYLIKNLQKQNPQKQFHFLIGSDLISTLYSWHQGQKLVKQVNFMIVPRIGYQINTDIVTHSKVLDCKVPQMSSTQVRKIIRDQSLGKEKKIQLLKTKIPQQAIELLLEKNML